MKYLAAVLTFCLFAAGCGGSSSGEANSNSSKKPQFVQQADAICRSAEAEREKMVRQASDQGNIPEQAEFLTRVALPPVQKMTEDLDNLDPPAGDDKKVAAIVAAFEKGVAKLEAGPTDLVSEVDAFAEADELSEEYGLADCGI